MKISVHTKPMSKQRLNLYLDFYPAIPHPETGKPTRREFLGLFLYSDVEQTDEIYLDDNGKQQRRIVAKTTKKGNDKKLELTDDQKRHNKETFALADKVKAQRQLDIDAENFGFLKKKVADTNFIQFFKALAIKQKGKNVDTWNCSIMHLVKFAGEEIPTSKINESFCNEFRSFILETKSNRGGTLSQNSTHAYFTRFKLAIKQAYKEGIINEDLFDKIETIKANEETNREHLALEELQKLVKTDCTMPIMKQAALFSALSGLRHCDIKKLIWSEVRHTNSEGYYLQYIQQKTGKAEMLPISKQAFELLGKRGEPVENVFKKLNYSDRANLHLKNWVLRAEITKSITFHCFRHTFACLQLSAGTDIYTVSKMLGHREIETTQIYAKVVNKAKRDAADKIVLEF